jgi:hypothetical protein
LAPQARTLIETALQPATAELPTARISWGQPPEDVIGPDATSPRLTTAEAAQVYRDCIQRWHILDRFPQPDWSIVDLWVMWELLRQVRTAAEIGVVVRLASPHFPRRHGDSADYLRRTPRALLFPPLGARCVPLRVTLPRRVRRPACWRRARSGGLLTMPLCQPCRATI